MWPDFAAYRSRQIATSNPSLRSSCTMSLLWMPDGMNADFM
jgi:hypothetical protein